ncbi:MAG: glucose-6-phosphate isomerase [Eubacteriales bacterium]|nr:glucose-6-phosphate isomerase [Eubacteriales bacterium]
MLNFSYKTATKFFAEEELELIRSQAEAARTLIVEKTGAGSDFLGWLEHPETYDREEFQRILSASERIRSDYEVLLVIGIGGSYLGARAVIEALRNPYQTRVGADGKQAAEIIFAGYNLSTRAYLEILDYLKDKSFAINVISKSGTTTEPAVAFRVFKKELEARFGREEAKRRIFVTTDRERGALKTLADQEGYERFIVPDDIGGRYSVLSAVGLLPIAAAGIDIEDLMAGARAAMKCYAEGDVLDNPAAQYAMVRNILMRKGFSTEITVNYEPKLHFFAEWWKQLFGESEGKCQRGIFPAAVDNTSDLHSMGQYIQEGRRFLFETVLWVQSEQTDLVIEADEANLDGLNFLAGETLASVNKRAMQGTMLAHVDGGVPNLSVEIGALDAFALGELIYFYELACAYSAYLNAVNPFNQPGVEAYKKNMFALLGKPGYEEAREALEARLETI